MMNDQNTYVYCYSSFIPQKNTVIVSKRPFANKFITYYPHEETILLKFKTDSDKIHIDTEQTILKYNTISHNFTVLGHNNKYYGVGGVSMVNNRMFIHGKFGSYREGLYLLMSDDCVVWSPPKLIVPRQLSLKNECCCFDGQPCFFYNENDKQYYLYQRWNSSKGRRKLQLFKSDNIENWSKSAPTAVEINVNINIYVGYIFKEKDMFYGIILYYFYDNAILQAAILKKHIKCGLIKSKNGIEFTLVNSNIIDYIKYGWPVMNSLHSKDDKKYIYCCKQNGVLSEQVLHL